MRFRPDTTRFGRTLAILSLVAYGTFGVFGHSLHGLLPCAHEACQGIAAALADDGCCDHCCRQGHEAAALEATHLHTDELGVSDRSAGHDPRDCALCTLLAKIKVGQAPTFVAELRIERIYSPHLAFSSLYAAELSLSRAPRGPPAC